jgi:hypothetical protein
MRRLKRTGAMAFVLMSALGCTSVLRGGDSDRDVHLHLTYFMARVAGFSPGEARDIAAADCYTDEHPETNSVGTERRIVGGLVNPATIPIILARGTGDSTLGGEPPQRGYGQRAAETTAWMLSPLAHRLHFPALGMYEKVEPAFLTDPRTGEVYYNNRPAVAVLEQAFRALETHDEDAGRTRALLGIGLHTLQDSYKHRGYCAALGHIGVWPDVDDISRDLGMAREIAKATLDSLRYARQWVYGGGLGEAREWKEAFDRLYATPLGPRETRQDRWRALTLKTFGDDYGRWEELRDEWLRGEGGAFDRAVDRARAAFP